MGGFVGSLNLAAERFIDHLGTIGTVFALFSVAAHLGYYQFKGYRANLSDILPKLFAGYGLPGGFGLLICAFRLDLLQRITNLEAYILAAAVCFLYFTWQALFPEKPGATVTSGTRG